MMRGKNCIITGARTGIGRATVELFAQNGANVFACASKYDEAFEEDMSQISTKYGVDINTVYFDLKSEDDVKAGIKSIISQTKQIDVLVNNAGIPYGGFLQMTPMSAIHDVFQINFFSQVYLMQLVSRVMMRNKKGTIVNLSSVAGLDMEPGYIAYGSSKAAIAFATKTLSKELAAYGIRVNAVAPGLIHTRMMDAMEEGAQAGMINGASLKREGRPEEVAQLILFLASDASSYINGQIIRVDGGLG